MSNDAFGWLVGRVVPLAAPPAPPPAGPTATAPEGDHIAHNPLGVPEKKSPEILWKSLRERVPALLNPSYARVEFGDLPKELRVGLGDV